MTLLGGPTVEACCSRDLRNSASVYLRTLSESSPDTTFRSQKTHLTRFLDWHYRHATDPSCITDDSIVRFVRERLAESALAVPTSRSYLCSLVNFIACRQQRDPELLKLHLASTLCEHSASKLEALGQEFAGELTAEKRQTLQVDIRWLCTVLRRRQYGTRAHAYVKMLLDTRSRPAQVRHVDISDFDLEDEQVRVEVPDTHVVSAVGLVTERVTDLSGTTTDALRSYIEHERIDPETDGDQPLFTTSRGRASQSTMRRSLRTASAVDSSTLPEPNRTAIDTGWSDPSENKSRVVTSNDVAQYARSRILTEE